MASSLVHPSRLLDPSRLASFVQTELFSCGLFSLFLHICQTCFFQHRAVHKTLNTQENVGSAPLCPFVVMNLLAAVAVVHQCTQRGRHAASMGAVATITVSLATWPHRPNALYDAMTPKCELCYCSRHMRSCSVV